MRESHMEQVERWARFVREHPNEWRKPHTEFINALFANHARVLKELSKTKEGREKVEKLWGGKVGVGTKIIYTFGMLCKFILDNIHKFVFH